MYTVVRESTVLTETGVTLDTHKRQTAKVQLLPFQNRESGHRAGGGRCESSLSDCHLGAVWGQGLQVGVEVARESPEMKCTALLR